MNRLHHAGDFSEKQEEFKEPFTIRFNQLLNEVARAYADKGEDFCVNLQGRHSVSFQVVSSGVLEEASDHHTGFGIDLPFDLSDQELVEQQQRFLALPIAAKFTRYDLDGIPTYQFNVGADRKLLIELVIEILSSVFQEEVEKIGFDHYAI